MEYNTNTTKIDCFIQFYKGNGCFDNGERAFGVAEIIEQLRSRDLRATYDWSLYLMPSDFKSIRFNDRLKLDTDEVDAFVANAFLSSKYIALLEEISLQLRSVVKSIEIIPSKVDIVWIYHSCKLLNAHSSPTSELFEITDRVARQLSKDASRYMIEFMLKKKML